jgi:hypothetical protein
MRMKRALTACGGWAAFACVLWLWSASGGAKPEAPVAPMSGPVAVATSAGADVVTLDAGPVVQGQPHVIVVEPPQGAHDGAPVRARLRVTLETLSDATAATELRPGEDMALAIQRAAMRAGRKTWYTADWTGDGKLDAADIAAFVAAYRAGLKSADLNHDGVVDARDYAEFMREFKVAESRAVEVGAG